VISIIIRTKNEERWVAPCLRGLLGQTVKDFEIILVDNQSTDKTVDRARHLAPDLVLVTVERFRPGHAINEGIRASQGEHLVCLSAHCVPTGEEWLANLLRNFDDDSVAGVYGRQVPVKFSSPSDKRDLLNTFGLDRRVQRKDTFFHNANSMVRRDVWERFPFDEEVTNIEDRVWAEQVIQAGYTLVYEPEAQVYHHHGIHQDNNRERSENVVRILESLQPHDSTHDQDPLDPSALEIAAIVPVRGGQESDGVDDNEALILETIRAARESRYIDRVFLSTDSEAVQARASGWEAEAPFLRPPELSASEVRVDEVLRYSLEKLEEGGYYPNLVVPLEITYPFRPKGLLDELIQQLLEEGTDTIIAGYPEYRPCWIKREREFSRVDDFDTLRDQREPVHIGLPSLGCVTYPEVIRGGSRLGKKLSIYEIRDLFATFEVRSAEDLVELKRRTAQRGAPILERVVD
jgi:CMP-N-acetylneuraminic acid synthetase